MHNIVNSCEQITTETFVDILFYIILLLRNIWPSSDPGWNTLNAWDLFAPWQKNEQQYGSTKYDGISQNLDLKKGIMNNFCDIHSSEQKGYVA